MNKIYVYFGVLMSLIIALVIGMVFINNRQVQSSSKGFERAKQEALERQGKVSEKNSDNEGSDILKELGLSGSKITSDELDIWTLPSTGRNSSYSVEEEYSNVNESQNQSSTKSDAGQSTNEKDSKTEPVQNEIENIPLSSEIVANKYIQENFKKNGDILEYYNGKNKVSSFGIEISYDQGNVNMKRLKNAGCEFVIIHVGRRGYSSGKIVIDENFSKNLENAFNAGLKVGVVFRTEAVTKDEIIEEADVITTSIRGYNLSFPIYIEFEEIKDDLQRIDGLSINDITDLCTYFLNAVEKAGYTGGIYASNDFLTQKVDVDELGQCSIWLSNIDNTSLPEYEGVLSLWQYGTGSINGISNEANLLIQFNNVIN